MTRDRATLSARTPIELFGYFWVSGRDERFPIEPPKRGVEVASIARQDRIYAIADGRPSIEQRSPCWLTLTTVPHRPPSQAAGLAPKSLSMGPAEDGNRVETAIRIGSLVTASFPRGELTTLTYSIIVQQRPAATDIPVATTNKERTERIIQRLTTPPLPKFGRVEDMAAGTNDPVNGRYSGYHQADQPLRRVCVQKALSPPQIWWTRGSDRLNCSRGRRSCRSPPNRAAFDRIHHASHRQNLSPVELISAPSSESHCSTQCNRLNSRVFWNDTPSRTQQRSNVAC